MKSLLIAAILAATTGPAVKEEPPTTTIKVQTTSKSAKDAAKEQDDDKELKLATGARREMLRAKMEQLAEAYSGQLKQKVRLDSILFATIHVNAVHDTAIAVFKYGKTTEAMLLVFHGNQDEGDWDGVPESFVFEAK